MHLLKQHITETQLPSPMPGVGIEIQCLLPYRGLYLYLGVLLSPPTRKGTRQLCQPGFLPLFLTITSHTMTRHYHTKVPLQKAPNWHTYTSIYKNHILKNVQNTPFCTNIEKCPVRLFQARFQFWFSDCWTQWWRSYS